jgi:flagellar basal-body rod modification protein FlgD
MAVVDAVSGSSTSTARANAGGLSALTSEDFAKIIFSELGRQDPLQPSDTKALLEQISSLRSIQSNMDLSNDLKKLVSQGEFASAATLIGKRVSGVSETGSRASGTVKSVSRTGAGAVVTLTAGPRINISNLDQIDESPASTGSGT